MAPWVGAAAIYSGTRAYEDAWHGLDWRAAKYPTTFEEAMERRAPMYKTAIERGLLVTGAINMLPYASEEYVEKYCKAVAAMGAFEIVLLDGPSGLGPEAYAHLVRIARAAAPNCRIGVHTHNMLDLATANALASVREGAALLEISVNGYCSAAGQADIAVVVMALESLYGIKTGIDFSLFFNLARKGEAMTGHKVAWNNPITGPEVFNWGGMEQIIQEQEVDRMIHWNIEPTLVGNTRRWDITRDSGPYAMWDKLDELGVDVEREHIEPILAQCKAMIQEKRRAITEDEIREIAYGVTKADLDIKKG
jgi:isopropylmalate/homocitrate/citramalate synthase